MERKNGWQLAEVAGDSTPDGMQDFLARMHWDADQVRDDLRAYVAEHLGDADAGDEAFIVPPFFKYLKTCEVGFRD